MDKYLKLILLFIFASLGFYNPNQIIDPRTSKFVFYAIALFCLVLAFRTRYAEQDPSFPKTAYLCIILGIIVSTMLVPLYRDQSLMISIQASMGVIFAYTSLYILMKFNPSVSDVEKLLVIMGFVGIFVNGVNMLTAPDCFFGKQQEDIDISRGFVRVRTPIIYICFLFFYSLSKFRNEHKQIWLLSTILAYAFIVFWVARQYIAYCAVLGLLLYMSQVKWYKKILIAVAMLLLVQFVVLEIPFVQNFIEMSETQKENADEDVRTLAYELYINDYQANEVTRVFGNGTPSYGNSNWGNNFEALTKFTKTYAADIGWGGFYFYYGLFAFIGLVMLFVKAIFRRREKQYQYISYLLLLFVLTSFAGGAILYMEEIVALMCFFYIAYKTANNQSYIQYEEC